VYSFEARHINNYDNINPKWWITSAIRVLPYLNGIVQNMYWTALHCTGQLNWTGQLDWTGLIFTFSLFLTCTSAAMSGGMAQKNIFSQNRYIPCHVYFVILSMNIVWCVPGGDWLQVDQVYNVLHLNYFWFSEIEILYLPQWPHFITGVKSH
jgi:hypothetical protein